MRSSRSTRCWKWILRQGCQLKVRYLKWQSSLIRVLVELTWPSKSLKCLTSSMTNTSHWGYSWSSVKATPNTQLTLKIVTLISVWKVKTKMDSWIKECLPSRRSQKTFNLKNMVKHKHWKRPIQTMRTLIKLRRTSNWRHFFPPRVKSLRKSIRSRGKTRRRRENTKRA